MQHNNLIFNKNKLKLTYSISESYNLGNISTKSINNVYLAGFSFLIKNRYMKYAKPPTTFQEQIELL